jgi:outer membrane protein
MNKFKLFLIAAIITIGATNASAQKIGYIRVDDVVYLMPELAKIDTALQKFQRDTINNEFEILVRDYKYRDSLLTKTDTTKMPASIKNQHRQEMQNAAYQIQNWQAITQQAVEGKQQEMLAPLYQKAIAAINAVAKEKGYAYVVTKEAFIVAPPGDDLLAAVAAKLNLKVPTGAAKPGPAPKK